MAASANPSGDQERNFHGTSCFNGVTRGGRNPNNGNSVSTMENSGRAHALKHNPGLSVEWTMEEQTVLEDGLSKYASEPGIARYAKIAMQLQDKTVRDVALRCRWMNKKENGKRRKEDHNLTRKSKDKKDHHPNDMNLDPKERVTDSLAKSSHMAAQPNTPPYALPIIPVENDDGISFKVIGGATGQLLEQNAQMLKQISANLASLQIQENIDLFCQTRDNILTIFNDLNDMPGIMKQMPPFPVKINEELANAILPRTKLPMKP